MSKSKKNQKLNLATLSVEALNNLSGYSVAITALKKLASEHDAAVEPLEAERQKLLKEYTEAQKLGTLTQEGKVEIERKLSKISLSIMALDDELKEDRKPYNKAKKAALAMVPDSIYASYKTAWETGHDALWIVDLRDFVTACGISADNAVAVANFAGILKIRCAGSRNAGKNDETGALLACKSQRGFDETVMKAFITYCVTEKKVLNRAEDGTLTKVEF